MTTKFSDENGTEALAKLFSSISVDPNTEAGHPATTTVSKEALERLAQRIQEIVGDTGEPGFDQDGIPTIEDTEQARSSSSSSIPVTPLPLKPMPLTHEERTAQRNQINAFLDALEEEERLEEEQERLREAQRETPFQRVVRETLEKQGLEVKGGSLVKEDQFSAQSAEIFVPTKQSKKSVTFADTNDPQSSSLGDIQKGRIARNNNISGAPMKLNIIERYPTKAGVDSDDEEEEKLSEESAEEGDLDTEVDDALHHREVALRYHELRQSLGQGPIAGPLGGNVEAKSEWDQEEIPIDATIDPSKQGSNGVSHFMAPRLTPEVLKSVAPAGLAGEIRPGKIVDGQLVGDDAESDEEIGEQGRKIIEGLTKGLTVEEALGQQLGGDLSNALDAQESGGTTLEPHIVPSGAILRDVKESSTKRVPKPAPQKEKISRFKANRME